jgi:hypothetical protein
VAEPRRLNKMGADDGYSGSSYLPNERHTVGCLAEPESPVNATLGQDGPKPFSRARDWIS